MDSEDVALVISSTDGKTTVLLLESGVEPAGSVCRWLTTYFEFRPPNYGHVERLV